MLNYQVVQLTYCIEMSVVEFQKIMDADAESIPLFVLLEKIDGVSKIEYDGHFGARVWLTIDKECDNRETWSKIKKTITKIIK